MPFDKVMLTQALQMVTPNNAGFLHYYLAQLTKIIPVLPPDVASLLKQQFLKEDDARYLIPIIPTLTEEEFKQFLPNLLKLEPRGLRTAIVNLLTLQPRPVTPLVFLIELHKFRADSANFDKVIEAMKICFNQTDVYGYKTSIQAMDVVARSHPLDLIMETLLVMLEKFKEGLKYIVLHLVPTLIGRQIYLLPQPWEQLKKLLYITKPTSFKPTVTLPPDKVADFVRTYPDVRGMVLNHVRAIKNQTLIQLLSEESKEDS
jgi:hypothetical protein